MCKVPKMAKKGWTDVPIPDELYLELQTFLDSNPHLGYRGVPEFVRDAARRLLSHQAIIIHRHVSAMDEH